MRRLACILFIAAAGCATGAPGVDGSSTYTSVKDRLAHPTRLYVGPATSSGELTAERYTHDGWVSGTTPLLIAHGELDGNLDKTGKLVASAFEVDVDPIDIPDSVFGKPAQLKDVRFTLASPAVADVAWSSDDEADATLTLSLNLDATMVINGAASPLGTQKLPPVELTTTLTGNGDHVDAMLSLDAMGTLWNWADLFKLTQLQLSLVAGSVDEM